MNGSKSDRMVTTLLSKKITLDGEPVIFEGEAPTAAMTLYDLLITSLAEQGRCLSRFTVDDVDVLGPRNRECPVEYSSIEAESVREADMVRTVIEEALGEADALTAEIEQLAVTVLWRPWPESVNRFSELSAKLTPVVELTEVLTGFGEGWEADWRDDIKRVGNQLHEALADLLNLAQGNDVAVFSDVLELNLNCTIRSILDLAVRILEELAPN